MVHLLFWISGVLLMAAEWQLEVIRLRATRNEKFSLPFFITSDRDHFWWSVVFMLAMVISYLLMAAAEGFNMQPASILLFALGFWQLSRVQFDTVAGKPYKPPMLLELAREEIEMDLGLKKLDRMRHVSFWGDCWLFVIFVSYLLVLSNSLYV